MYDPSIKNYFLRESEALLNRLNQVKTFDLNTPMLLAASPSVKVNAEIDQFIAEGKLRMKSKIFNFIRMLKQSNLSPNLYQKQFSNLKLSFNVLLDHFDMFSDTYLQRAENDTGVWLAGLDFLARDALFIKHLKFKEPAVICYLERGHGAAIRRIKTPLSGGRLSPVSIIRVPRERMIGLGIAGSLLHEIGHQGAANLNLVKYIKMKIDQKIKSEETAKNEWLLFQQWISEIIADFWAVSFLGVGSTIGLFGLMSIPEYFIFRRGSSDPHPYPWIRVLMGIQFGKFMFPDSQWDLLTSRWKKLYPLERQSKSVQKKYGAILAMVPNFVSFLMHMRLENHQGLKLIDLFPISERQPRVLRSTFDEWKLNWNLALKAKPSFAFAVLGQAQFDNKISPNEENKVIKRLLKHWALKK